MEPPEAAVSWSPHSYSNLSHVDHSEVPFTMNFSVKSDITNLAGITHDHHIRLIGRAPVDSFLSSFVHDRELLNNISFLTKLHFDGNGHRQTDAVQQVIHPLNANSLRSETFGRESLLGCAPAGSKCQVV